MHGCKTTLQLKLKLREIKFVMKFNKRRQISSSRQKNSVQLTAAATEMTDIWHRLLKIRNELPKVLEFTTGLALGHV